MKQLYPEKIYFLKNIAIDSNLRNIEIAYSYFKLMQYDSSYYYFKHADNSLLHKHPYFKLFIFDQFVLNKKIKLYAAADSSNSIFKILTLEKSKNIDFSELDYDIKARYNKYEKYRLKKSGIAIGLSALIPGLGKMYINKKYDALTAFVSVASLGLQWLEVAHQKGFYNWRSLALGGATFSFYTANIYGTYKALKKQRIVTKKELINTLNDKYFQIYSTSEFIK